MALITPFFAVNSVIFQNYARSTLKAMTSASVSAPSANITRRSTPNATPEQSGIPTFKASIGILVNGVLRQTARRALTIILFKALLLLTGIRQFMETIRQLNTFIINLKAFSDPMIFGTDLRQ